MATVVVTNRDSGSHDRVGGHRPRRPRPPPATGTRRRPAQLPAVRGAGGPGRQLPVPGAPETGQQAVNPPRTGKVPTDPAQVSASMATNQGNIGLQLDNAKAPCTVNSFASLAQQGYFNDTPCHRLTTTEGWRCCSAATRPAQGTGGPGYQFANEYPTDQYQPDDPALQQPVTYPRGTLAMANAGPGHQRQPVLPGVQGLAAAAELHGVRHHRRDRPGHAGQDRRGRHRRRRRGRQAEATTSRSSRSCWTDPAHDHSAPAVRRIPAARRVPAGPLCGYDGYGYPQPQATNSMAIVSLVCAFLFAPLGIVFGHISLSQIKKTGEEGRGLAVAGLVISY